MQQRKKTLGGRKRRRTKIEFRKEKNNTDDKRNEE